MVSVNIVVDLNRSLWNYLTDSKNCDRKYQEITDSIFVIKTKIHDSLIYKHIKNKRIIVVQWTIVKNVPSLVLSHDFFLITHNRDIDCRTTISNNPLFIVFHLMNSTLRGPLL